MVIAIKFRNTNEIQEYYQAQLSKGNQSAFKNIKRADGKPFQIITDKILTAEADRLRKCIQKHLDDYYSSYTPKYYVRTYGLRDALTVQTAVQYSGSRKYIGLYFDESKSWGRSVVTGSMNGWKPYLMNFGWKDTGHATAHFQGYRGYGFIEKGIKDWKSNLQHPIDIEFGDSSLDFLSRIL